MNIEIGQKAPDFKLLADDGKQIALSDLRGKKVILYFYPKDDTSGCTKEACGFSETQNDFTKTKAVIIGVSKDSVTSHQKFKQKYQLPFILLSDDQGLVCEKYKVMAEKSMYGKKYIGIERSTFLIDEQGIVQKIWRKVKVDGHVAEVLENARTL